MEFFRAPSRGCNVHPGRRATTREQTTMEIQSTDMQGPVVTRIFMRVSGFFKRQTCSEGRAQCLPEGRRHVRSLTSARPFCAVTTVPMGPQAGWPCADQDHAAEGQEFRPGSHSDRRKHSGTRQTALCPNQCPGWHIHFPSALGHLCLWTVNHGSQLVSADQMNQP